MFLQSYDQAVLARVAFNLASLRATLPQIIALRHLSHDVCALCMRAR